jgi:transportin-3
MGLEWTQVVLDLVKRFSQPPDLIKPLFTILEVLPEECENYHTSSRVDKTVLEAFRAQIKSAAPEMLRTFGSDVFLGTATDINSQGQILRCFAHWLRACDDSQVASALQNNRLVATSFDALATSDLFDSALSAICELVLVSTHKELRQLLEYLVPRAWAYKTTFAR